MKRSLYLFGALLLLGACQKKDDAGWDPTITSFVLIDVSTGNTVFSFFIPQSFTPNGDFINEFWYPVSLGLDSSDYYINVTDKAGNSVYETTVPGNFDGSGPDHMLLPAQTFTYFIEAKAKCNGQKYIFKGNFCSVR